jgi:hypothetical protein
MKTLSISQAPFDAEFASGDQNFAGYVVLNALPTGT